MQRDELYAWFRIIVFAVHFCTSIALVGVLFGCDTQKYDNTGYMIDVNETCTPQKQCFRSATNWTNDNEFPRHRWNPFSSATLFEFYSASFACFYLRDNMILTPTLRTIARFGGIVWAFIGSMVYIAWYFARSQDQWCEVVVACVSLLFIACVQFLFDTIKRKICDPFSVPVNGFEWVYMNGLNFQTPIQVQYLKANVISGDTLTRLRDRLDVIERFLEYTVTSPILFIGVLSTFVNGPPAWCFIGGFFGMVMCNAMGVPLHLTAVSISEGDKISPQPAELQGDSDTWGFISNHARRSLSWRIMSVPYRVLHVSAALLSVGTWHEHWVAKLEFLKDAWFGLAAALMIVLYTGKGILVNSSIPTFVLVILWNKLITYSSFGIAGTLFYSFDNWWPYFIITLDTLSLFAKIPVAISICFSFLKMPGGGCH